MWGRRAPVQRELWAKADAPGIRNLPNRYRFFKILYYLVCFPNSQTGEKFSSLNQCQENHATILVSYASARLCPPLPASAMLAGLESNVLIIFIRLYYSST